MEKNHISQVVEANKRTLARIVYVSVTPDGSKVSFGKGRIRQAVFVTLSYIIILISLLLLVFSIDAYWRIALVWPVLILWCIYTIRVETRSVTADLDNRIVSIGGKWQKKYSFDWKDYQGYEMSCSVNDIPKVFYVKFHDRDTVRKIKLTNLTPLFRRHVSANDEALLALWECVEKNMNSCNAQILSVDYQQKVIMADDLTIPFTLFWGYDFEHHYSWCNDHHQDSETRMHEGCDKESMNVCGVCQELSDHTYEERGGESILNMRCYQQTIHFEGEGAEDARKQLKPLVKELTISQYPNFISYVFLDSYLFMSPPKYPDYNKLKDIGRLVGIPDLAERVRDFFKTIPYKNADEIKSDLAYIKVPEERIDSIIRLLRRQ